MEEEKLHLKWEREQEFLNKLRESKPELFEKRLIAPSEILDKIGITAYPKDLPLGYIRYLPQDFIVEELREDETIEIEPSKLMGEPIDETGHSYFCDLVKINISTFDAVKYLSEALGIETTKIQHAGIKDQAAITAQKISITETDEKKLKAVDLPSLYIKNCRLGKGALAPGQLAGNRFTILVRTGQDIIPGRLNKRIEQIKNDGILNFYGMQRFGMPRFLSHELGKYILKGQFELAVKTFLVTPTPYELPAIALLREKARPEYGNWQEIRRLFSNLPYLLRYELAILDYLIQNPRHFSGALKVIREQSKFWIYAYNSYLFNQILSALSKDNHSMPEHLPTIINPDKTKRAMYEPMLKRDGISDFKAALQMFGIPERENYIETKIFPEFVTEPVLVEDGVIFSFNLPKGAYATTLLNNLFRLYGGHPVPDWVKTNEYDSKKLLGLGSIASLRPQFGEWMKKTEEKVLGDEV